MSSRLWWGGAAEESCGELGADHGDVGKKGSGLGGREHMFDGPARSEPNVGCVRETLLSSSNGRPIDEGYTGRRRCWGRDVLDGEPKGRNDVGDFDSSDEDEGVLNVRVSIEHFDVAWGFSWAAFALAQALEPA
jgi:hypothetical protein